MSVITSICQAIGKLAKQVILLPHSIPMAIRQKWRQGDVNKLELERLDRIRNPAKYRGK
jgi:hypothetical protein